MRRIAPITTKKSSSKLKDYIIKFDFVLLFAMCFLLGIGLIFIYSTGFQNEVFVNPDFLYKQLFWITISLPLYVVLSSFDYRFLRTVALPLYGISLLLLIAVLLFGVKIYGAKRWLDLGFSNFQPSELMKISLILILAAFFSRRNFDINKFGNLCIAALLTGIPFVLIFVEPDFGSALILVPLMLVMVFTAGLNKKFILIGSGILLVVVTVLALNEIFQVKPMLKEYHRKRITAFFNPDKAPRDLTHQSRQAQIAIGSGGWKGKGLGNGTQHTLGYLPRTAANNDFIFSVIAEEGGFFLAIGTVLAYLILTIRLLYVGYRCEDLFGRFLSIGCAMFFFTHVFVNICVNIGLAPVTGLPLPFISYGGSFILSCFCALGIGQSVSFFSCPE